MHSTWHTEWLAIAARCGGNELSQPLTQILHLRTCDIPPITTCADGLFLHPLAQILYLHSSNVYSVVVVSYNMYRTPRYMHTYVYTSMHTKQSCYRIMHSTRKHAYHTHPTWGVADSWHHSNYNKYRVMPAVSGYLAFISATNPIIQSFLVLFTHCTLQSHMTKILEVQNSNGN